MTIQYITMSSPAGEDIELAIELDVELKQCPRCEVLHVATAYHECAKYMCGTCEKVHAHDEPHIAVERPMTHIATVSSTEEQFFKCFKCGAGGVLKGTTQQVMHHICRWWR